MATAPLQVSCLHLQEAAKQQQTLAGLTYLVGTVPISICTACVQAFDKLTHIHLLTHAADPAQQPRDSVDAAQLPT